MVKFIQVLTCAFLFFDAIGQENPMMYKIYDGQGKEVAFHLMTKDLAKSEVVLFGEMHNNSVVHWLQLELTTAIGNITENKLTLGAEMFEADDQLPMDEYLNEWIDTKNFEKEVKLWNNYHTDYKPLLDYALENKLRFIATNVPRRYAHLVAHKGLEGLKQTDAEARKFMAPMPLEADSTIPGYAPLYGMSHGSMSGENFMYAQALKDATMAYFIQKNLAKDVVFIHFNGDYHSRNQGGIYHYLKKDQPKLNVKTIAVVEDDELLWKTEYDGLGDYLIITPSNVSRSY